MKAMPLIKATLTGFLAAACLNPVLRAGAGGGAWQNGDEPAELDRIMDRASFYYGKLDRMLATYFCRETVREVIYPLPEKYRGSVTFRLGSEDDWVKLHLRKTRIHECVYDYQMVRRGKRVRERRTLLREDGVEKREENSGLKTLLFDFKTMAYGPVAFADENRDHYDFRLLGRETCSGRPAVLVESRPKANVSGSLAWGRYWIDAEDASFLRVELAQQVIGGYEVLEKKALALQAEPQVTVAVDYGVQHGGMRFLSRFFLEEAYIGRDKERVVLSSIEAVYEDFRFFRVETQVKEKEDSH